MYNLRFFFESDLNFVYSLFVDMYCVDFYIIKSNVPFFEKPIALSFGTMNVFLTQFLRIFICRLNLITRDYPIAKVTLCDNMTTNSKGFMDNLHNQATANNLY